MAMAFIAISRSFVDFGFGNALIQSKATTDLSYSSVFYLNLVSALFVFAVYQLLAPAVARYFDNPELIVIIRIQSVGILFSATGLVQASILQKQLDFKGLSTRNLFAGTTSGVVGVAMAFAGFGVYALVGQYLVGSLIGTVLLWRLSDWKPSLRFSFTELKRFWVFGSYVFLSGAMANIMQRIDILMIGKLFSASTLGYFTRAESLNNIVSRYTSQSIKRVMFSSLSSIQDDKKRFNAAFLKILKIVSFLVFLLAGEMVLCGDIIILNLFGTKWEPSVVIFQILMLKIFTYPVSSIVLSAMLSAGFSKEAFWYDNATRLMRVASWLVAYFYGFDAYLWVTVGIHVAATVYYNFALSRTVGVSFGEQIKATYTFAAIFVVALAAAWGVRLYGSTTNFVYSLLSVVTYGAVYLAIIRLTTKRFFFNVVKEVNTLFTLISAKGMNSLKQ